MNFEPSTSPTLIARVTDGDAAAWSRFVGVYGPLIYQWSRRLGLQPCDAADAVQDTMSSVHRNLNRYRIDAAGTFRGWLWTITRRRIADAARRRPDQVMLGSAIDAIAGEPPGDLDNDRSGVLRRAVLGYRQRFDERTWSAFWQTVVDGRTPSDVAADLGVTPWAVYKARARILQTLRNELADLEF